MSAIYINNFLKGVDRLKGSYKRYLSGLVSLLLLILALIIFPACAADGVPQISITEPKDGSEVAAGNVTVFVEVMNFDLVNKLAMASVAGEGHIHYFMDAAAPTAQGKPAITKPGTYVPTVNTSYTWTNVAMGMHNFSVELVNNDHTPLSTPVVAEVNVTAKDETLKTMSVENVTVGLIAKNIAFNTSTITVPAGSHVTVNFDNQDANVPHNFAVYDSASAKTTIFKGDIITGPKMIAYTFDAPTTSGTYFFRCDVHPTIMTGQFIVK
jgi:plastocyanin